MEFRVTTPEVTPSSSSVFEIGWLNEQSTVKYSDTLVDHYLTNFSE